MYHPGQHQPLARLRPEKLDDAEIQKQIALIQQACGPIDPDLIAVVFHECDYHLQNTIARIKAGDFENSGWQTAKSNTKKKLSTTTPAVAESLSNGGESFRRPRPSSSRAYLPRRGTAATQARYPVSHQTTTMSNENKVETLNNATEHLSLESPTPKKNSSSSTTTTTTKRPLPSSIPHEPVSMHPTVQLASEPFDIQFGDVTWKDSIPRPATPVQSLSQTNDEEKFLQAVENKELEASASISNSTLTNHVNVTSHLSDHLNESSEQGQQSNEKDSNISSHLPSTSTPHPSEYPSTASTNENNSSTVPLASALNGNPSAFMPYNTSGVYPTIPRDYSQTGSPWSTGNTNYKTIPSTVSSPSVNTYPPPPPPPHTVSQPASAYSWLGQQPYLIPTYSYPPQVYQVIPTVDAWSSGTYTPSIDHFGTYPNYVAAYPTPQPFHPTTKFNVYPSHEKEFFHSHGQNRTSNPDHSNNSQSSKDPSSTSKLSATAPTFSQAAPLTATSPTGAFLINPLAIPMAPYLSSHSDRTITPYASVDSRDNRNGAPYGSQTNRNYYQQQQQQQPRLHSNPTWHPQQ